MPHVHTACMDVLAGVHAFVAVAQHRSFSAAAAAEGAAQPVMSRRVAALELRLGGPLLDRTSRQVHLSPLGLAVLGVARRLLSAEQALHDMAAAHHVGVLTMLVPPDLRPEAWAAVTLHARANDHSLQLDEDSRDQRALRVRSGEVGAALTAVDSAVADWTVELGLAGHHEDARSARLLRPVRARRHDRRQLLLMAEDAAPELRTRAEKAAVRLGLGVDQVQPAGSTTQALADVIAGDARLLCAGVQAQHWGLDWQPAPELGLRRHYRVEANSPASSAALLAAVGDTVGRALGARVAG